jgi:tubulin polyglutamylase TTLL6/13
MSVAQEYVKPFLLAGLKFDLRIYVLVTSVDPLRVYVNDEGMVRFCTEPYEPPAPSNLDAQFAHLTNFSLNKHNSKFTVSEEGGHKRYLTSVYQELARVGVDVANLRAGIDRIVRLTLLAAQQRLSSVYHTALNVNDGKSRCFEILGFDIIVDEKAQPWLLEVNCMPSLQTGSPLDHDLKKEVVMGALQIVEIPPTFKARCMDWFKAMSMGQTTEPLFDPAAESARARATKWRQLIPVVGDPAAASMCQEVGQFLSSNNETRATKLRRDGQKAASFVAPPVVTLPKPRISLVASATAVIKQPIRPPPIKAEVKRPTPKVVRRDMPRAIMFANEARMTRMAALNRLQNSLPMWMPFRDLDFAPCWVVAAEEGERERTAVERHWAATGLHMQVAVELLMSIGRRESEAG